MPLQITVADFSLKLCFLCNDLLIFYVHNLISGGNGGGGKHENGLGISSDSSEVGSGYAELSTWSLWTKWSDCTSSCGEGSKRFRHRTCGNVINGIHQKCSGNSLQIESCTVPPC